MRMLDLFSGIGGISLAAEWAGIETVAFCEIEPFCQKVLQKHWPSVPIFHDVRKLTGEMVLNEFGTIEVVAGGFPCQPHSLAGRMRGREDEKDLWPEMFRIIREIRPSWVVGENVANFANTELERTCTDLEGEGFQVQSFVIPANGYGAPHRRKRTFIVAHSASNRNRIQEREIQTRRDITVNSNWWKTEPRVGRVADGVPSQVDRLRSLGNAVVPQQIYPVFKAIMEVSGLNEIACSRTSL